MADGIGFGSGLVEGQQAQAQQQLQQLALAKGAQDIEAEGLKIQGTKLMLDQQKALLEKMHSLNNTTTTDPGGQMDTAANKALAYGNAAMDVGLFSEGMDALKTGTEIQKNAAAIANAHAERMQKNATLTGDLMAHVHDQQSWDQAIMVFQTTTGEKSPYAGRRYSPELVQRIRDTAITALQQSEIIKNQAATKAENARVVLEGAEARHQDALTKAAEAKAEKEKKEGMEPDSKDVAQLQDRIRSKYGSASAAQAKADAERSARLVTKYRNEGLTRADAADKAFKELEAKHAFAGYSVGQVKGSSSQNPKDAPLTSANGPLDSAALHNPRLNNKWIVVKKNTRFDKGGDVPAGKYLVDKGQLVPESEVGEEGKAHVGEAEGEISAD